ncbi:MAG: lipopolysaccharide heptosyltransferase II [Candidatus Kapabacteria bacterium]|nr:lipopolysaccharide heptosyltransferase II [Candidatus Kapabacteria bacterium]
MRSILIIRLTSLGDVVLSTPLVRQLRRTYPDAVIDVMVHERCAELWKNNPHVHHVWDVDPRAHHRLHSTLKAQMRASVPDGTYDLIVDLQHNHRSRRLRRGLGRTVVLAPKHRLEKLALVWRKRFPDVVTSVVSRYRSCVDHLPLALDVDGPEVWLPEEGAAGAYGGWTTAPTGRIALAPGAQHATKRWPAGRYAQLCDRLWQEAGLTPVLLGSAADSDVCAAIANASVAPVERADGATSIEQTLRVLDTCDALVTNDSGVMHLGAARRRPIVAIFGSTVPAFGFAPYGTRHVIVEHSVACRPCTHIGRPSCPKGHFACMQEITVDAVIDGLRSLGIFAS